MGRRHGRHPEAGSWFANGQNLPAAATERIGCDARLSWATTRTGDLRAADAGGLTDDERELVRAALRRVCPALGALPTKTLDLGRTQRLVTPAQRRALASRDRGCSWPGCDRPPDWCDAHHLTFWSHGGTTDLPNLTLICARHHTFAHDGCS